MNTQKYVGLDVHQGTIVVAVLSSQGKVVMEAVIETKAQAVGDFFRTLRGRVEVTLEEGTHAAWLAEVLRPHVAAVTVCDPRKNKLLLVGHKSDRVDARKLAQLLRAGLVTPVYPGPPGTRTLKELARSYEGLVQDGTRVMNRLKALYRARAIPCAGERVYRTAERQQWLGQLTDPGVRSRAELLYRELDTLTELREAARAAMIAESRKHPAQRLLQGIATLGPVRVAQLIAVIDTPHRFRSKRQLWAYSGLAVVTRSSADYQVTGGAVHRATRWRATRGLTVHYNRTLKHVFKDAAVTACARGAFKPYYEQLVAQGRRPAAARLTVARKIAAITLAVWKKGEPFDPALVRPQAA
jgi:transposase